MSFKVTWKIHLLCFLIAYIFCLIFQNNICDLFLSLFLENKIISLIGNDFIDLIIFLFIILMPITVVHELLHGFAYRLFGGQVRYGFKGLYAYAQEITGIVLHKTKFLIVLLAPVTVISLLSVLIPGCIGEIVFLLNILGSLGDLLMAFYLCKCNEDSYVIDRSYGFDIVDYTYKNSKSSDE